MLSEPPSSTTASRIWSLLISLSWIAPAVPEPSAAKALRVRLLAPENRWWYLAVVALLLAFAAQLLIGERDYLLSRLLESARAQPVNVSAPVPES